MGAHRAVGPLGRLVQNEKTRVACPPRPDLNFLQDAMRRRGVSLPPRLKNSVQTAFVTGGTGFVGINLVSELTGQGWAVTCLHRHSSNLDRLRRFPVRLVVGDLNDEPSLRAALPENVDAVFHVAADTSSWKPLDGPQTQTNVIG